MIHVLRGGRTAEPRTPPMETRLRALPFLDMNHWGGRVELLRLMEPWPRSRSIRKPTRSMATPFTRLIQMQVRPRRMAMAVVIVRCPSLSKRPPITPIVSPAVRVPMEYMPETRDLLHPNSTM